MNRLLVVCVMAIVAVAGGALVSGKALAGGPAAPYAAPELELAEFYDALAPYGDWVADERFGYVWYPNAVQEGWRPYTVGNWVYTEEYGWYWASPEPYAWAVYHYGRWGYDAEYGWYWVPGDTWSPAWVQWRYSDDYVGWAPEAPVTPVRYGGYGDQSYFSFGLSNEGFGFSFGSYDGYDDYGYGYDDYGYGAPRRYAPPVYAPVADAWTFVRPRYLVAPAVRTYAVPRTSISLVFNTTKTVYRPQYRNGIIYNAGMPRAQWSRVTRQNLHAHRVHRAAHRPGPHRGQSRAYGGRNRDLHVYAPRVKKHAGPHRPPKKVAQKSVRRKVTANQSRGNAPRRAVSPPGTLTPFERAAAVKPSYVQRKLEQERRRPPVARPHQGSKPKQGARKPAYAKRRTDSKAGNVRPQQANRGPNHGAGRGPGDRARDGQRRDAGKGSQAQRHAHRTPDRAAGPQGGRGPNQRPQLRDRPNGMPGQSAKAGNSNGQGRHGAGPQGRPPEAERTQGPRPQANRPPAKKAQAKRPSGPKPQAERTQGPKPQANRPPAKKAQANVRKRPQPQTLGSPATKPQARKARGSTPQAKTPPNKQPQSRKPQGKKAHGNKSKKKQRRS